MSLDPKSDHYDVGGIEVLDVIKAKLTSEQYEGYLLGNAIKYLLRMNHKGERDRDAEKAKNYVTWLTDWLTDYWLGSREDESGAAQITLTGKTPTLNNNEQ